MITEYEKRERRKIYLIKHIMKREDIIKKVIQKVNHVGMCKAELDDNLKDDLGFDSLDMVELSISLERQFGINIPEEEFEHHLRDTVHGIVDYVEQKL